MSCTSRVLQRVTRYSWHWGPECECLGSKSKAGAGRLAEGSCYPSCPSTLTFIPGYWWPWTPGVCWLVSNIFFPFVWAASKLPQKCCALQPCGCMKLHPLQTEYSHLFYHCCLESSCIFHHFSMYPTAYECLSYLMRPVCSAIIYPNILPSCRS